MPTFILAKYIGSWVFYSIVAIVIQSIIVWFFDGAIPLATGVLTLIAIIGYIPFKIYLEIKSAKEYSSRLFDAMTGKGDIKSVIKETIDKVS